MATNQINDILSKVPLEACLTTDIYVIHNGNNLCSMFPNNKFIIFCIQILEIMGVIQKCLGQPEKCRLTETQHFRSTETGC